MGTSNPVDVGRLTSNEVETFRREGFLLYPEPIFSEDKFRRLVEHFEGLLEKWPKDERPEGMDVPHFSDPALFEWLLSDEVLDLVEPLLGPDLALFTSHFICKPGADGRRVPWHEDSNYWKDIIHPINVVTV